MGLPSPPRPLLMSASSLSLLPHPPPCPGTLQLSADSPVAARWLQTHGHARRSQSRGTRGRGRAQGAGSQPPRLKTLGAQNRAEPWRLRLPFSFSAELRRDSGTGPKKDQEILFTARGEEPIEPLFGKSASPASRGNVFLVTLTQGRPVGENRARQVQLCFRRRIQRATFVHLFEFVEIPFPPPFASLARRRACPDLVAAPTSPGLLIRAVSRGSPSLSA